MKKFLLYTTLLLLLNSIVLAAEIPRWVGLPIYVYIPKFGYFSTLMEEAFNSWEKDSKGLVRFKLVNNPANANIEVEFVDFVANCHDANAVGCTEMLRRGRHYYKSYITIGTKEYKRGYINGQYKREIIYRTRPHIYGVMLHEVGHAIGLNHSENKNSIMYPYDLETMQYITGEDLKLLYKKYH